MKIGLIGATGLVGNCALQQLLADDGVTHLRVWARRAAPLQHEKLQWIEVDFDDLTTHMNCENLDAVLCALGTTQGKAGKAGLMKVDHDYVLAAAQAAKQSGVKNFALVSALGSSLKSPSYYSRVKAQAEQAVETLGFSSLNILRPSLLLGERDEHRPAEALGQKLAPLLNAMLPGPLKAYRAVDGAEVAAALITLAKQGRPGCHRYTLPLQ